MRPERIRAFHVGAAVIAAVLLISLCVLGSTLKASRAVFVSRAASAKHSSRTQSSLGPAPQLSTQQTVARVQARSSYHQATPLQTDAIWESPAEVKARGLFDGQAASHGHEHRRALRQRQAAAAKVLSSMKEDKGHRGPLPQVRAEAIKVAEEAAKGSRSRPATGTPKPWQESAIQKGVLGKESTQSNLMRVVKERDDRLLRAASGLSAEDLSAAVAAASHDTKFGRGKKGPPSHPLQPWEQKEQQQGALRHETVEENLKKVLKARERKLLKAKTGWKSMKDVRDAESFANNLEREIKSRKEEEASHPLIPRLLKGPASTPQDAPIQ